MKETIRKILREQFEYKEQLFSLLRTGDEDNLEMVKMISQGHDIDVIELLIEFFKENGGPYFKILKHFNLSEDVLNYVSSEVFGQIVNLESRYDYINNRTIYSVSDKNGNMLYYENSNGFWVKYQYNENGLKTYTEDSKGRWYKTDYIYDNNQNVIESITMDKYGLFEKILYDKDGNIIYFEDSDGYWEKLEFDENGNQIYYEDSNGDIIDRR